MNKIAPVFLLLANCIAPPLWTEAINPNEINGLTFDRPIDFDPEFDCNALSDIVGQHLLLTCTPEVKSGYDVPIFNGYQVEVESFVGPRALEQNDVTLCRFTYLVYLDFDTGVGICSGKAILRVVSDAKRVSFTLEAP